MQVSVLGPVLVADVFGGLLERGNCTIMARLTYGCQMSGDGQENFHAVCHTQVDASNRLRRQKGHHPQLVGHSHERYLGLVWI